MILVIQFRTDQSGWHELKCVYESSGITYGQLQFVNASSPHLSTEDLIEYAQKADGVILCGLGESGYEEIDPVKKAWVDSVIQKINPFIKKLIEIEKPTLGICFGHQLLGNVLGSEITLSKEMAETGVCKLFLTKEAESDPIFEGIETPFRAVVGHKASVATLPHGATHLVSSDKCPVHGFKVGKNIYGLQFHAELDYADLEYRLSIYPGYRANSLNTNNSEPLFVKRIIENFVKLVANADKG